MDGQGTSLGYRALHQKIRQRYCIKVPRDLVHRTLTLDRTSSRNVIRITNWMGGLYTATQRVISGFHSVALG